MIRTVELLLLLGVLLAPSSPALADAAEPGEAFDFALIGDFPYFSRDEQGMPHLLREIREAQELRFVIHLGDFHNPRATACSDALFTARFEMLSGLGHPFVLTPGDNDWADCEGDPSEHLKAVRRIFFADPGRANGPAAFPVRSQSESEAFPELVENAIWEHEGVVFATLHMIQPSPLPVLDGNADSKRRLIAAGEAWLDEAFALAHERDARGVFLATQASLWPVSGLPKFLDLMQPELLEQAPAFDAFKVQLARLVRDFGRPVVLANGDTHYFRVDKPLTDAKLEMLETFTRVEGFGTPHGHWVRVSVEPDRPEVFSFRQELVEENLFTLVPPIERDESGADPGGGAIRVVVRVVQALVLALTWLGAFTVVVWIVKGVRRLRRRRLGRPR